MSSSSFTPAFIYTSFFYISAYIHPALSVSDDQPCRSADTGVIAQCGQHDLCILVGKESLLLEGLLDERQKGRSRIGNAAADDDHLGIHDTLDRVLGMSQISSKLLRNLNRHSVVLLHRVKD